MSVIGLKALCRYWFFGVLALSFAPVAAPAKPVAPGDILTSTVEFGPSNVVAEFTPTGQLVQTFGVPTAPGGDSGVRGLAVDFSGNIQIFNGTFSPYLTTLNPNGNGMYSNRTYPRWSTINNVEYGGLTVYSNYVYVTDMWASGDTNGIVRFNIANGSAALYDSGSANGDGDYKSLSLGLNGMLYATWPGGSPSGNHIDVIDPNSMAILKTISVAQELGGVTADASGNLYGCGAFDTYLYKFDSNGNLLNTLNTGIGYQCNIQISNTGQLAVGSRDDDVVLSNTSLSTATHFYTGMDGESMFASFAQPLVVPEPSGVALLSLLGSLRLFGRRRGH